MAKRPSLACQCEGRRWRACPPSRNARNGIAAAHSLIDGRVAMEFDPKSKAAAEMTELYNWLAKQLKI